VVEDEYPLQACINEYLFSLFVVTKKDVLMYDLPTGVITGMHNNLFDRGDEEAQGRATGHITRFCIDKRHRKAYVANNHGQISLINCQNGVVLKNVTDVLEQMSDS
jgi:hypothetical protein